MLQHTRTKAAKLVAENMVDFFIEHYFKPLMKSREEFKGFTPEKIDSLKITMPRFYKWMMGTSLTNIEGIFDLKDGLLFSGKHILLIDDVLTTGSTLEACVHALEKTENKNIKISIFTLAVA